MKALHFALIHSGLVICPLAICSYGYATPWSFMSLGDLPGGQFKSAAYDVSDDGSAVSGSGYTDTNNKAFQWTQTGGMVQLESSTLYSHSSAITADGQTAVGWIWNQATARVEAFRWTDATGAVGIGDLAGGTFESYANDVSADGSVIVGLGHSNNGYEALLWTQYTGCVPLGDLAGGNFDSTAHGVSRSGNAVVGHGTSASGTEAYLWTVAGGMMGLGDLEGGEFYSHAEDVLADGAVVIGNSESSFGTEAFRWTESTGMVGLGDLPGGDFVSRAWGGSEDGTKIVGMGTTELGSEAFIWDQINGTQNLRLIAETEHGLDLTGWTLTHALAMSADGSIIVGQGINPAGDQEAWMIRAVPEPPTHIASIVLGTMMAMVLIRRRVSSSCLSTTNKRAGDSYLL